MEKMIVEKVAVARAKNAVKRCSIQTEREKVMETR
jgi:hypothetical protein